MQTMRAMRLLDGPGRPLRLSCERAPEPGPGQVRLRAVAVTGAPALVP